MLAHNNKNIEENKADNRVLTTYLPDWRWQASELILTKKAKRSEYPSDRYLNRLLLFRIYKERRKNSQRILRSKFKDLLLAYDIHFFNDRLREELEARILGKEDIREIAKKFNIDTKTIHTYIKIFFDVVDKLDNQSYICGEVINFENNLSVYSLWKILSYFGGYYTLDKFLIVGDYEDLHNKLINFIKLKGYTILLRQGGSRVFSDLLKSTISNVDEENKKETTFITEIKQLFLSEPKSNIINKEVTKPLIEFYEESKGNYD